ncbi:MAG TPA: DinB family protein [Anaerolineae bacterium]|nr:DinB family protein [Anaerolineae bacterium]
MNRQTVLDLLQRSADDLQRYVSEIPADRLHWREPGEWSAHETLAHVCEVEREAFLPRAKRITTEHEPRLPNFESDAWHTAHYDPGRPLAELLADFAEARRQEIELLAAAPDWSKWGFHEGMQKRYSLNYLAQYALAHTWEHLHQIAGTQKAYELERQG